MAGVGAYHRRKPVAIHSPTPARTRWAHGGKKATGRTAEGLVVMHHHDLLRELAAYIRNTLRFPQAQSATVTLHPTPSPDQQRD